MSDDLEVRTQQIAQDLERREVLHMRNLIHLGIEAEAFLKSSLGQYLQACAKRDREEAMTRLLAADPMNHGQVAAAQTDARIARRALEWLAQAIHAGTAAEHAFIEADA